MGTHAVLDPHVGRRAARSRLDLLDAVERYGETALGGGNIEFVAVDAVDAALHPVVVDELDEVVLRAERMGRRSLEAAVPFLDAQVADAHRAPALVHDAHAGALAGEPAGVGPFADYLAVDRHGDHALRLAGKKLEARLRLLAEIGHGRLTEVGQRLVFLDRQQVHGITVDLHAVKASEVRLILLGGEADRLERVRVQREGQMHRAAPLEVERQVRAVRQVKVAGDRGGRLGVEPTIVVAPVAGLADGLVVDLAVRPAVVIFRPLKERLQPLGQWGDLAHGVAPQLQPACVPGVDQEMLVRRPGEVAAEMVAVDQQHLAKVSCPELANGRAVKGDPGEL